MNQVSWLYAVPSFMLFCFFCGAFVYAITKRSDGSSAKMLAVAGVSILFFVQIARLVSNMLLAQFVDQQNFGLYYGLYSIASTLVYMLGIGMIIVAVFVGRKPADSNHTEDDRIPSNFGDNPYASPVS